ncbi:uncharacterized protein [Argopecten irradians]|uniref:uncharacterized protein n=1 Tax=Argopecten irradians TaxID=31199 RepID=UPI00371ACA12
MKKSKICKVLLHFVYVLFLLLVILLAQSALVLILSRKKNTSLEVWYVCVCFVLIIPEIVHIITMLWCTSFLADQAMKTWPLFRGILSGIFLSITEAGCLSMLTYIILPRIPSYIILPILNFSLLPQLSQSVEAIRNKNIQTCLKPSLMIIGCVAIVVAGIVSSIYLSYSDALEPYQATILPILLIGASISLYSPIQTHIHGDTEASYHKTSLFYGSFRIFTYVMFCLMCFNKETVGVISLNLGLLGAGFQVFSNLQTLHLLIVIHITFSFVSLLTYIAPAKSKFTTFCSWQLSPILIAIFCIVLSVHTTNIYNIIDFSENPVTSELIIVFIMCGVLTLITICYMLIPKCFKDSSETNSNSGEELTFQYRYNSVLLLQFLLIQKKILRSPVDDSDSSVHNNRPSRVYVCTTMYQEAEHEMDRLLVSLKSVISSHKLKQKNVYIESHIFLDNGAEGKEIKDFGKQLYTLAEERLDLQPESGRMLYTPYGIQLHWDLEHGTPFFIHLKDTEKVKAKKRWSQVMYLEYVLKYRSKWEGSQGPYGPKSMYLNPSIRYESTESLVKYNDFYLGKGEARLAPTQTNHLLDVPDIILNDAEDLYNYSADTLTVDMSSNDGSLYPSETPSRNGSEIYLKETPLEIHTQDSTIFSVSQSNIGISTVCSDNFILMTDADMVFDDEAVLAVIDVCKNSPDVGGVCGRTYPTGLYRHPILWLQVFEYAKDFWMMKSSQNVIGSVMCCPGCFSLFRFEALSDILQTYESPTESVMDVFTKDNGEDRWMCTLMMLKGWKLRYVMAGRNSTFCPETTLEFMKQRRRWLLSDYTNAFLVMTNIANLISHNSAFSLTYALYQIQLFFIMILYPGATVIMLSLGLELGSGIPLFAIAPTFFLLIVGYSILLVKDVPSSVQLVASKVLIIVLGLGTLFAFGSTSVIIMKALIQDFQENIIGRHIEYIMILSLTATYPLAGLVHPSECHLLIYGLPYMFFLPLLNIILPVYAFCNIIDQSWGTRDDQLANISKFLRLPKVKKKKKPKKKRSTLSPNGSFSTLNSSVLDLQNFNEDEVSFWEKVVGDKVGVNVSGGLTSEERTAGLRVTRNKVTCWFLLINAFWVILLCACYGLMLQLMDNKTIFSIVMLSSLGLTPLIQVTGMLVDRGRVLLQHIRDNL